MAFLPSVRDRQGNHFHNSWVQHHANDLLATRPDGRWRVDVDSVPALFHQRVQDELSRIYKCQHDRGHHQHLHEESWFWDCLGSATFRDGLARGIWVYRLAWWLDVVGARHVTQVWRFEDVQAPTAGKVRAVLESWASHMRVSKAHVDEQSWARHALTYDAAELAAAQAALKDPTGASADVLTASEREELTVDGDVVPPMLPETRALLEEFYAPYNEMLADLLGDARFNYNDEYESLEAEGGAGEEGYEKQEM